jgi:hypothetical protein
VLKACEYRPQDRYASAKELYEALDALQTGRDSQTSEASKNSSRQENQTVQPEETYSTVIATTLNGQTASNRETAYNGQTSYNGPEESNSWGASVGTIGNPGGKLYNNDGKSTDFITETMGKQEVVQKKNIDKKQDETDELLKKIDVFKSVPWWSRLGFGIGIILCFLGVMCIRSKEDFDISLVCILIGLPVCLLCVWIIHFAVWEIILEILLLCGGSYLFISGLMSAQIITYLGVAGLFILGPSNFIKWMYQNKKKIADFDDLIKTNPEFAKRLYYEKCPQKNLVKYIEKLNSTVAREIKVSPK